MSTIAPQPVVPAGNEWEDEGGEPEFKPLSAEEARRLRERMPQISPWQVLGLQLAAGAVVAAVAGWMGGARLVGSAVYGVAAVVVPAALFARGLARQRTAPDAGSALAGFFVWELVKIALTVAMLVAAPRLVAQLSWLALVAGFVVTMKVYWVAMWLSSRGTGSVKNRI